jgi:hypothetical protein
MSAPFHLPPSSLNDKDSPTAHRQSNDFHLQVLGRDGGDLPFYNAQKEHDSQHNNKDTTDAPHTQEAKNHWWNGVAKRFITTTNNNSNTGETSEVETTYSSLVVNKEDEKTSPSTQTTSAPFQEPLHNHTNKQKSLSTRAASLLPTRSSSPASASTSTRYSNALEEEIPTLAACREDDILQESSFFYRDLDDDVLTKPPPLIRGSSIVLPPIHRSAYHARYQQLNQEYIVEDDLDLFVENNEVMLQPRGSIIQDFSNSSLYYKQDGRVLMKLPKDKVRLVMDPELGQAGILSSCTTNKGQEAPDFGDITHVLTVSPDIYQKVVLELAHSHTTILSGCFESEDKLSIQVAILLLSVMFILLFINVIIYPGD